VSDSDLNLYPSITPFREGLLELDHGHQMHWQLSGNADSQPVLWIHGGPGSRASPMHRRLFDPNKYLIIQYDQRGCGRSLPKGETRHNTTQDLLADIERLRRFLGISAWHVAGGSWGGSLALLYAQAHPEVIRRMLLRSPFLATEQEINAYLFTPPAGCQAVWEQLSRECNQDGPATILEYSHRVFGETGEGKQISAKQSRLARAWVSYESAMDSYPVTHSAPTTQSTQFDDQALIARYRIHLHYLWHRCFLDKPIVDGLDRLKGLDLTLVHGDCDALCPFDNSLLIQKLVPQQLVPQQLVPPATLVTVPGAGHNAFDERMIRAVVQQIERWGALDGC